MHRGADVLVIGGGIAGVSVGYELAGSRRVILAETEAALAQHTTGRSAALYSPSYGSKVVRALTAASLEDFRRIEADLAGVPLLSARDVLWVAAPDAVPALAAAVAELGAGRAELGAGRAELGAGRAELGAGGSLVRIEEAEALSRFPALRPEMLGAAARETGTADIDVAALHQAYVRGLRQRGGQILAGQAVSALEQSGTTWRAVTPGGVIEAAMVVNAAGAWADEVAGLAGIAPAGLEPRRRTLFTSPVRQPFADMASWPWILEVNERFYCRPEATQVLASPADETASPPCDAQVDPLDVARAIELVNEYTAFALRSVTAAWAGLRTFAPDRNPVVGERRGEEGFFWMAGQGGYGIQMAPALARTACALALGEPCPVAGAPAEALSPERLSVR